MNYLTLEKLAKDNGFKLEIGMFDYWENVVFLNNTAVIFTLTEGTARCILCAADFPKFVTKAYIVAAVKAGATHLGHCDGNYKPFINGYKKWHLYNELGGALCNGL